MAKNGTQIVIEEALLRSDVLKKDVAKAFGVTAETFSKRLKTGKFSYDELQKIAELTNSELVFKFEMRK